MSRTSGGGADCFILSLRLARARWSITLRQSYRFFSYSHYPISIMALLPTKDTLGTVNVTDPTNGSIYSDSNQKQFQG